MGEIFPGEVHLWDSSGGGALPRPFAGMLLTYICSQTHTYPGLADLNHVDLNQMIFFEKITDLNNFFLIS